MQQARCVSDPDLRSYLLGQLTERIGHAALLPATHPGAPPVPFGGADGVTCQAII